MAQFLRPSADVSLGAWLDYLGGSSNIYTTIDESSASDTDYVIGDNSTNDTYEFHLSDPSSTPAAGTVTIRYRYGKSASGGNARNLTVALYQGGTSIATNTHTDIAAAFVAGSFTPDTSSVTDWTDLRIRLTGGGTITGSPANKRFIWVSWLEMETPDGAGTFTGSGTPSITLPTASGAGEFDPPIYTGSGAPSTPLPTSSGSGTFTGTGPTFTGSGSPSTPVTMAFGTGWSTSGGNPTRWYPCCCSVSPPGNVCCQYCQDNTCPTISPQVQWKVTFPVIPRSLTTFNQNQWCPFINPCHQQNIAPLPAWSYTFNSIIGSGSAAEPVCNITECTTPPFNYYTYSQDGFIGGAPRLVCGPVCEECRTAKVTVFFTTAPTDPITWIPWVSLALRYRSGSTPGIGCAACGAIGYCLPNGGGTSAFWVWKGTAVAPFDCRNFAFTLPLEPTQQSADCDCNGYLQYHPIYNACGTVVVLESI